MKTTLIRQRTGRLRKGVFTHNDRSELTAATMGDKAFAYDYDNIGNRKTAQEEANDFTYTANALNQYTQIAENEVPFIPTFDADGNQTRIKTTTGIWEAVYNAFNRPLTFTRENADGTLTVITADYDYMGRRVFKKVETVATDSETGEETHTVVSNHRFLYRGYLQIAALDLTRTTLNELWFITWDPTEPVATRPLAIQKDGTWYTYGLDLPKNITEIYGTDGYIKTAYTYSPYGLVTSTGNITQPLQWSSEFTDTDLALVYYNYRHYNPLDGRWTGRDDMEEMHTSNVYAFTANNPTDFVDYLGLEADDGASGFSGTTQCERNLLRKEIKADKVSANLLKKVGLHDFKVRFNLQTKKCTGCCVGTNDKGISKSLSSAIQIEGEAGTSTLNIANLAEIRLGWYGRLGATGSIAASCSSCSNKTSGNGCINVYGELGLIGKVSSKIASFDAGARGGVNVRASVCVSVNSNQIQIKARACISLRVRGWFGAKIWPFGKIDYNREWQDQLCTPWGVITTF
jgi:RHS repeat-associated protein